MDSDFARIKLDDLVADYPSVFDGAEYVDVGIGWLPLVKQFVDAALPHDPSLAVFEIKEKFGCMRIWSATPVLAARLAKGKVEFKSSRVCEICGNPGFLRRPPPGKWAWWRTLCDDHASPDQRSEGAIAAYPDKRAWRTTPTSPLYGYLQVDGDWYRYDESSDAMVPSEPPARWR